MNTDKSKDYTVRPTLDQAVWAEFRSEMKHERFPRAQTRREEAQRA